jgi:hypothetical protein
MGGRIELPRAWHDGKAGDLNHWKPTARDLPVRETIWQSQNAPVMRDVISLLHVDIEI